MVPAVGRPGTTRIRLTGWQSIGLIIVILSFLVGAAGMAASGFVAAHDWGCKVGLVKRVLPAASGHAEAAAASRHPGLIADP